MAASPRRRGSNRWTIPLANSPPILVSFLISTLICIILLEAVVRWPNPQHRMTSDLNRRALMPEWQPMAARQVVTAGASSTTANANPTGTSSSPGSASTTTTESSTLAPVNGDAIGLITQSTTTVSVGVPNPDSVVILTTQSAAQTSKAATTTAPSPSSPASSAKSQAASSQASQSPAETSNAASAGSSAYVASSSTGQAVASSGGTVAFADPQSSKDVKSSSGHSSSEQELQMFPNQQRLL